MTNIYNYAGLVEAPRIESETLLSVRLAQYPSGAQVMQGAYQWTQGFNGGVIWKDMPIVLVGTDGQEIVNE